ncbi:MAG: ThuA domain-containing protein [Verrucomicrobiota bacterium]
MKIKHLALTIILGSSILTQAADAPKRVLVCTTTVGFRHSSIPQGEEALAALDASAPDFEIVTWLRQPDIKVPQAPKPPRKPARNAPQAELDKYNAALADHKETIAKWKLEEKADLKKAEFDAAMAKTLEALSPQALRDNRIDAVVFCNTSGALPLPDHEGFASWVKSGGAFIGMHAGSDTLKDSLPFTDMLCGTFDGHGPQVPATLHAGDKEHPANGNIGDIWTLSQEEMYLIKNHDREKVRSIWFMRHHPNQPEEKGFFPVAWVRGLGEGRIFYTTLGHREDIWSLDPALPNRINSVEIASQFRRHILGGIRWALGLAPASSDPNPAIN